MELDLSPVELASLTYVLIEFKYLDNNCFFSLLGKTQCFSGNYSYVQVTMRFLSNE